MRFKDETALLYNVNLRGDYISMTPFYVDHWHGNFIVDVA